MTESTSGIRLALSQDDAFMHLLSDFLQSLGVKETEFLGEGMHGYACLLNDGSVLKVTTQAEEAAACWLLMDAAAHTGEQQHHWMNIHAVARLGDVYAVVREDAADLPVPDDSAGRRAMTDAFNHLNMEWEDRDEEWCGWQAWIMELERQNNAMAPLLRTTWEGLERLEELGIHVGDVMEENMGMLDGRGPVLRDLSTCDVPDHALERVGGILPGEVITGHKENRLTHLSHP